MTKTESPSPCGIVCKTCIHRSTVCARCHDGGGEKDCHIRNCTTDKKIAGCWQCDGFPCGHLQTLDPAWKGLTLGLVEIIRELGGEEYRRLALENIGEFVDYGYLRFMSPEQTGELVKKGR